MSGFELKRIYDMLLVLYSDLYDIQGEIENFPNGQKKLYGSNPQDRTQQLWDFLTGAISISQGKGTFEGLQRRKPSE